MDGGDRVRWYETIHYHDPSEELSQWHAKQACSHDIYDADIKLWEPEIAAWLFKMLWGWTTM